MSIVELDLVLVGELRPVISVVLLVAADDVTERSSAEEVLLLQSQLFTAGSGVVGVEDAGDVLCGLPLGDGTEVVSRVEGVEVELVAGSASPEAQIVGVVGVVAWDGRVIGLSHHDLAIDPVSALDAMLLVLVDAAVEAHGVDDVTALDLPRVPILEPEVGDLNLAAVLDHLLEDAVVVPDAVAPGWQLKCGHGVQEAGGEAAETTVAKRGVRLLLIHILQVVPDVHEGALILVLHVNVDKHVLHEAAHEELKGEVVNSLHVFGLYQEIEDKFKN